MSSAHAPSGTVADLSRHVTFMATPALWPAWPFLPVVRRSAAGEETGLLFDARAVCGRVGYSATVFLGNLFALPPSLDAFFALPTEVFDAAEEAAAAGWRVD